MCVPELLKIIIPDSLPTIVIISLFGGTISSTSDSGVTKCFAFPHNTRKWVRDGHVLTCFIPHCRRDGVFTLSVVTVIAFCYA